MKPPNRCRLVLVMPENQGVSSSEMAKALSAGDVASVIFTPATNGDADFKAQCDILVPVVQHAGAAAIVANDTQIAGRCNADGIHLDLTGGDSGVPELKMAIEKFAPRKIVGAGNVNTRHMSLSIGECGPDYVFFGKLRGDTKPQPHPKMLALAEWWSQIVELPGICMGASALESVVEVAQTGIDFVGLSSAIFSHEKGFEDAIYLANKLLDENAPEFDHDHNG